MRKTAPGGSALLRLLRRGRGGRRGEPRFADLNGNVTRSRFGNPCRVGFGGAVLDDDARRRLGTVPVLKKKPLSSRYEITNSASTYWRSAGEVADWSRLAALSAETSAWFAAASYLRG